MATIEIEHLTKRYGDLIAVDDISFEVREGEILGLLGPNGAGKTTTMRVLTCYLPPTSGKAWVAGYDVFDQSMEARRQVGYVPENPPLYEKMTVEGYLKFAARINQVPARERKQRIGQTVDQMALGTVRKRLISNISKGFKQRVALAQALIHQPDVLILDEPTVGLDPKQIIEIRQFIKELGGTHTVILSTHILPEVEMTCERVAIINRGRIVAIDSYEALAAKLTDAATTYVEVENDTDIQRLPQSIPGVIDVIKENSGYLVRSEKGVDVRKDLSTYLVQSGMGLLELKQVGMTLEDIFLELTTEEEVEHA